MEVLLPQEFFCYGKDTITYKKKLIKALKQDIEMDKFYNQNHKGV